MIGLLSNVEFWQSIASLAWPAVVLVIFLTLRDKLKGFFGRDNLTIKVAGMEISVADATKNLGSQVADIQKKLAEVEQKIGNGAELNKRPVVKRQQSTVASKLEENVSPRLNADNGAFSILWVDDYPINNAFIVEQFRSEGIQVQLALSTKEGMTELNNKKYDIVISDLGRQEDGIENRFAGIDLTTEIRKTDKNIPILIFAGSRGVQNKKKIIASGVNDVTNSAVEVQRFVMKYYTRRSGV